MRVDGVHIRISPAPERLVNSPELDYKLRLNEATGEVESKSAEYRGLFISVYSSGAAYIRGSIHKYCNGGMHNCNELSHAEVIRVVQDLQERFGIDPNEARITQIEIGVNVRPTIHTNDLLAALILHKTSPFNTEKKRGREFCQVEHDEYTIKAYDKSQQFDTFRFEIAARKRWKNHLGIHTLSDLKCPEKYNNLGGFLQGEFGKLLIIDPADTVQMVPRDAINYHRYTNPKYWGKLSPDYRHRRLKTAQTFICDNGLDKIFKNTQELIERQIELNQADTSKHPRFFTKGDIENETDSTPPVFHHLDKEGIIGTPSTPERLCAVTGLDISSQHPSSRYLSPAGLKLLAKNNPETFRDIIIRFGPYNQKLDQDTNLDRIAHRIRNFPSNQWRDMRNLETKYQDNYSLFSDKELYGPRAILALVIDNDNKKQGHGIRKG